MHSIHILVSSDKEDDDDDEEEKDDDVVLPPAAGSGPRRLFFFGGMADEAAADMVVCGLFSICCLRLLTARVAGGEYSIERLLIVLEFCLCKKLLNFD